MNANAPAIRRIDNSLIAAAFILAPLSFTLIYQTVLHLAWPGYGRFAYGVPFLFEGSCLFLYMLDIRMILRDRPVRWLHVTPWVFAAGSLAIQVSAGQGSVPGIIIHALVALAFYVPLIFAEHAVRRDRVTDADERLAQVTGDAYALAADLLTGEYGRRWARKGPVLLVRQVRGHRLPAPVVAALRETATSAYPVTDWETLLRQFVNDAIQAHRGVSPAIFPPPGSFAAQIVQAARQLRPGATHEEIAQHMGKARTRVSHCISDSQLQKLLALESAAQ